MCYHLMMLCWEISEKHWVLKPFEWLGNWLEDWGLDRGYIEPMVPQESDQYWEVTKEVYTNFINTSDVIDLK